MIPGFYKLYIINKFPSQNIWNNIKGKRETSKNLENMYYVYIHIKFVVFVYVQNSVARILYFLQRVWENSKYYSVVQYSEFCVIRTYKIYVISCIVLFMIVKVFLFIKCIRYFYQYIWLHLNKSIMAQLLVE